VSPKGFDAKLRRLASDLDIQLAYRDFDGVRRIAGRDALLAAVTALHGPIEGEAGLDRTLAQVEEHIWSRGLEPVVVVDERRRGSAELRLPAGILKPLRCAMTPEDGPVLEWTVAPADLPQTSDLAVNGHAYVARALPLPPNLPFGYHQLQVTWPGGSARSTVLSTPGQVYAAGGTKLWGAFLPVHALHTERTLGGGDLTDLEALARWLGGQGAKLTAALPLLAAFLDRPFDPSPYAPVSRLFWNEIYLDLERVPEAKTCPEVRNRLADPQFRREMMDLSQAPLADHRRIMSAKSEALDLMAAHLAAEGGKRHDQWQAWLAANPARDDYANFRATVERQPDPWPRWPDRLRDGDLAPDDFDSRVQRRHSYAQWVMDEQLSEVATVARQAGAPLYLDLPIGVHSFGYDTWRHRDAFALKARAGAPPDPFFAEGQDWTFHPPHPQGMRENGYSYLVSTLRNHLSKVGALRVDHVMGLHRLYWIPNGIAKSDGVYVRYRSEELYALLCIESHRHQALLIGENLGLVPNYVQREMKRRRLMGMHCLQFESGQIPGGPIRAIPHNTLACLDTHDTAPFASYLEDLGPAGREVLAEALRARGLLWGSHPSRWEIMKACHDLLASSDARTVLVNLEDLWMETNRQNQPGTVSEYPNWRRRARLSLEEMGRDPEVLVALRSIDERRGQTG
jgi:4-alpha-glucanotransferase